MTKDVETSSKKGSATKSAWINITLPLRNAMVHWPGNDPPRVELIHDEAKGDRAPLWEITISTHTGTHIDAPRHFQPDGKTIDQLPLDIMIGPARVIEIKDTETIKPGELAGQNIQAGERLLFKTVNSSRAYQTNEFYEDFVYFSTDAAHFLAEKKVSVVGLDYIAVGSHKDVDNLKEVHETLFNGGAWIIEGLNLSGAKAGRYELICLPLIIEGGDACPARAVIRPL
jgi:arylformamidase